MNVDINKNLNIVKQLNSILKFYNMKAVYARVSTANQKTERQLQSEFDKAFIDVCSGVIPFLDRAEAIKLASDETITEIEVKEVSRLGRNLKDILNTIEFFTSKGVNIHIQNQGLNTLLPDGKPNPTAQLLISILGSIAQQEREIIQERTQEGREIAKINGKFKGRKRGATTKNETLRRRYMLTINLANELLHAGRSLNYVCETLKKQNELLPKESQYPGANRMTLSALQEKGLLIKM